MKVAKNKGREAKNKGEKAKNEGKNGFQVQFLGFIFKVHFLRPSEVKKNVTLKNKP